MLNQIDLNGIAGSETELLEIMTEHAGWVRECLSRPRSSWTPSVAVLLRDLPHSPGRTHLYVLDVPFNKTDEKREAIRNVGRTLYAAQCVPALAVMSSEAWLSPDPGPGRAPADHPDRREVIIVAGSTLGGHHMALQQLPVTRDDSDKLVPGLLGEPVTKGIETTLLNQLWAGFFEVVIKKHGMPGG